jgi:hypothetical protein
MAPPQIQWSGDISSCQAGDIDSHSRARMLALVNYYRALAQLQPVTNDPQKDAMAQNCALMMEANRNIDHFPPSNWKCYSASGATSASKSNLVTNDGFRGIPAYMEDYGVFDSLGHRRWILSNSLGPKIGIGSTLRYSCLQVVGNYGEGTSNPRQWTAWPPPGEAVPIQAANVDRAGWHIQSDSINLNSAIVSISEGGVDLPIKTNSLRTGYGSTYGISMIPDGWKSVPGKTYEVSVTGVRQPFRYSITFVDCK